MLGPFLGTFLCIIWPFILWAIVYLLIAKLHAYTLSLPALNMIYDYLLNRKQRTKIGSSYSTWENIISGVPQESIFGPLLFNIFYEENLQRIRIISAKSYLLGLLATKWKKTLVMSLITNHTWGSKLPKS